MTSPFDWKGKPSQVVNDHNFKAYKGGKSRSQIATEGVQKAYDQGKNVGSIIKNDETTFEQVHRRKK
jgi:hypothetical protein